MAQIDFTKETTQFDENGNTVIITVNHRATLDDGVAEVFIINEDDTLDSIRYKHWKTNGDGSRSDWVDINEVVDWFQNTD